MSTATAPTHALTVAEQVQRSPVVAQLNDRSEALLGLLPDQAAVQRFIQVSTQALTKNPDLLECTPESVILSIFEAAAQGLEPTGAAGGAHLVPYNVNVGTKQSPRYEKRAQLIPDYRGVIRLVTKPPSDVQSLEARVVKEGDEFEYSLGLTPVVHHVPSLSPDRSAKATTHVYAIARLRDGSTIPDVEDRAGIERVRAKGGNRGFSPWASDWDEMAKKTIIKRLAKVLPVRPEIRSILVREDELAGVVDVDGASRAEPVAAGPTKVSRLARQLRDVTPSEAPGAASDSAQLPESTDGANAAADAQAVAEGDVREAGLTQAELLAALDELGVDRDYAIGISKRRWGEGKGALEPEERVELLTELRRLAGDANAVPWEVEGL